MSGITYYLYNIIMSFNFYSLFILYNMSRVKQWNLFLIKKTNINISLYNVSTAATSKRKRK